LEHVTVSAVAVGDDVAVDITTAVDAVMADATINLGFVESCRLVLLRVEVWAVVTVVADVAVIAVVAAVVAVVVTAVFVAVVAVVAAVAAVAAIAAIAASNMPILSSNAASLASHAAAFASSAAILASNVLDTFSFDAVAVKALDLFASDATANILAAVCRVDISESR